MSTTNKQKAIALWFHLSQNGGGKEGALKALNLDIGENECPACDEALGKYNLMTDKNVCRHCPMYDKWHGEDWSRVRCDSEGTYYSMWLKARLEDHIPNQKAYAGLVLKNIIEEWKD